MPPGAGPHDEADGPPGEPGAGGAYEGEEVLLDENARKEEGKHAFYMVWGGVLGVGAVWGLLRGLWGGMGVGWRWR